MTTKPLPERFALALDKYSRAQVKVRLLEVQLRRANKEMCSAGEIYRAIKHDVLLDVRIRIPRLPAGST